MHIKNSSSLNRKNISHKQRNDDGAILLLHKLLTATMIVFSLLLFFVIFLLGYKKIIHPTITYGQSPSGTSYTEDWVAKDAIYATSLSQYTYGAPVTNLINAPDTIFTIASIFGATYSSMFTVTQWELSGSVNGHTYTETWTATDGMYAKCGKYIRGFPVDKSLSCPTLTTPFASSYVTNWQPVFTVTAWHITGTIN